MKKTCEMFIVVLVALLVAQPMLALAASPVRVIPTGKVSLLAEGKEVSQFQSEMPLPQGLLMVSNGSCLVQTQSLQFVAQDKAVLALAEAEKRWDLTVKSGRVDFALRAEAKPVAFHTPHDLIQTERAVIPASNEGLVRGYVSVTENGTELAVQEGALQVASSNGSQIVQAGHSIVLAQADVNSKKKDDNKKPVAGAVSTTTAATGGFAGLTTQSLVLGGLVTGGIVAGVASSGVNTVNNDTSPY